MAAGRRAPGAGHEHFIAASSRRAHHLSILRRRLRHPRSRGPARRCDYFRRSRASGQFRAAVLERLGLRETLSLDQRLLHPMFRQADGSLERTDWDTALAKVANGLRTIVDRDGPNAIAFYLSGQLLTEDYYVANKLMKGFLA